jgi:hypothetical protein
VIPGPLAHVLVAREDLPIPEWLFAWGASIVLIASFFALSVAWRSPLLQADSWRARLALPQGALGLAGQWLAGSIGVGLLGLTIYAGLDGTEAPDRNFALTFVFVTVWVGFPVLSALFGDLFRPFNPWRAIGRAGGGLFRFFTRQAPYRLAYPEWLGRWPAVAGLFAFGWLELVYGASSGSTPALDPHSTAVAALVYSGITLAMMALFGTETWVRRGETFSVYFNMFSQLSPLELREGRLGLRRPLSGAPRWKVVPGSLALVVAAIAITTFDGAQEGAMQEAITDTFEWFVDAGASLVTALRTTQSLYMLLAFLAIGLVYLIGVRGMRTVHGARAFRELRDGFAHTLIPIAFAYLLAHYFSLLVFQEQAQFTYLLSDPLGTGTTDIFGTAGSGVDYGVLGSNAIWYVQVGALVVGHVAGLVLAHDRAIAYWGDYRDASRSQYWMLAVMVIFTCFGLFLLSSANA